MNAITNYRHTHSHTCEAVNGDKWRQEEEKKSACTNIKKKKEKEKNSLQSCNRSTQLLSIELTVWWWSQVTCFNWLFFPSSPRNCVSLAHSLIRSDRAEWWSLSSYGWTNLLISWHLISSTDEYKWTGATHFMETHASGVKKGETIFKRLHRKVKCFTVCFSVLWIAMASLDYSGKVTC